jgi:hypothetical protein
MRSRLFLRHWELIEQQIEHQFRSIEATGYQNVGDVFTAEKNDWMPVLAYFFVGLPRNG